MEELIKAPVQQKRKGRDRNEGDQKGNRRRGGVNPDIGGTETGRDSRMGMDRGVCTTDRSSAGGGHHHDQRQTLTNRGREVKQWAIS